MDGGAQPGTDGVDAPSVGWASGPWGAVQAADAAVSPDGSSLVGGAPEPVDVVGGPVERAVTELRNADFDRWLDELVRDAFGDVPAPGEPGRHPEGDGWDIGGWHDPGEWLDARATARPGRFARARDRHRRFPGCRRRIPRAGEPDRLRP